MDDSEIKIENLQKWRSVRKREMRIDSVMHTFCRSLKKTNKQLSQIQQAWNELVPEHLCQVAIPFSFKGGVLEVTVDGSPTAYQVNRLVRSGLLRQLQEKCSGTLRRVRVRIAR